MVADGEVNYNIPDPVASKDSALSRARKIADVKGVHIALSNPCFEFWYLLHFQYTTKFFKDYPAVKTALTAYLPDYGKADDVYSQLSEHTMELRKILQISPLILYCYHINCFTWFIDAKNDNIIINQ